MSSPTPSSSSSSSSGSRSPNSESQHEPPHDHDRPPSSPSTTRPHHLLPPLIPASGSSTSTSTSTSTNTNTKPGGTIYANEVLDPQFHHHGHGQGQGGKEKSSVPEKCFTFCNQSQDRQPICRMFCLRRRRPIATQGEQLKRLRPNPSPQINTSNDDHLGVHQLNGNGKGKDEGGWWNPFKALESRLSPYSFIYVKGTPDGVVGRYMEELEGDDGNCDFGSISRGASESIRRRGRAGWEYVDWGAHGALLHLPLTSLFYPIISFPQTLERVFRPSYKLLNLYQSSFHDGSQERNLAKIRTEIENGGAFKLFDKIGDHYRKKVLERRTEIEKQMKEREERKKEVERELKEKGTIVFGGGRGDGPTSAKE